MFTLELHWGAAAGGACAAGAARAAGAGGAAGAPSGCLGLAYTPRITDIPRSNKFSGYPGGG